MADGGAGGVRVSARPTDGADRTGAGASGEEEVSHEELYGCGEGRRHRANSQLCQDALIETLEELFVGKKYNGQQSRKELKIFKQDLPVPEDYDADVDTDAAAAPYIVVRMTGGEIKNDDGRRRWSSA